MSLYSPASLETSLPPPPRGRESDELCSGEISPSPKSHHPCGLRRGKSGHCFPCLCRPPAPHCGPHFPISPPSPPSPHPLWGNLQVVGIPSASCFLPADSPDWSVCTSFPRPPQGECSLKGGCCCKRKDWGGAAGADSALLQGCHHHRHRRGAPPPEQEDTVVPPGRQEQNEPCKPPPKQSPEKPPPPPG